jgi:hypothetical protein
VLDLFKRLKGRWDARGWPLARWEPGRDMERCRARVELVSGGEPISDPTGEDGLTRLREAARQLPRLRIDP